MGFHLCVKKTLLKKVDQRAMRDVCAVDVGARNRALVEERKGRMDKAFDSLLVSRLCRRLHRLVVV